MYQPRPQGFSLPFLREKTWGQGWPCMGYIGMCCRSGGYGFQAVVLWDRVYKSESLGLEEGILSI